MNGEITAIEEQRMGQLQQARLDQTKQKKEGVTGEIKSALSFGKKLGQHWLILVVAIFFDILALVPGIGVVFNLIFGLILFLYFGPKKKKGGSELVRIALPILGGSVIDFFIGILPVNIGAALIRIALS